MYKTLKTYSRTKIGYFINYVTPDYYQPFQIVGTLSEYQIEPNRVPYFNDDWFGFITQECWFPRTIIDGNNTRLASGNVSRIDNYIMKNHGDRYLFEDDFYSIKDYNFEPSTAYELSAPFLFKRLMNERIRALFDANREKYNRLYEAFTAEYDPLKDLSEKITVTHSGTDSKANSGTDTRTHSGTDTTTHSGKDTTQDSGTDTTTHGGQDTKTHTGTETDAESGSDSSANTVFAFDSVSGVNKDATTNTYGKTDTTTYNTTENMSHGETIGTTHGKKSELTHGETIAKQHGESVATLHGKTETTTHGEKVVTEKEAGNREPAELLKDHISLWRDASFLNAVAYDIVKCISTP